MTSGFLVIDQLKELEGKGDAYRKGIERRIARLEKRVFKEIPFTDTHSLLDPNTLLARVDRLEGAMRWWKK